MEGAESLHGYSHTLATVWSMNFARLSPDAASFLGIMSFLSPDSIQVKLFCYDSQMDDEEIEDFSSMDTTLLPICKDEIA